MDFNNGNDLNVHLKSGLKRSKLDLYQSSSLEQRLFEKQTSFDKQLDSLTDLLSEMETRGPFNPKVPILKVVKRNMKQIKMEWGGEVTEGAVRSTAGRKKMNESHEEGGK